MRQRDVLHERHVVELRGREVGVQGAQQAVFLLNRHATDRVHVQLAHHALGDGRRVAQHLVKAADDVVGIADDVAVRLDVDARLLGPEPTDRVEVLERQPDGVQQIVAAGARGLPRTATP